MGQSVYRRPPYRQVQRKINLFKIHQYHNSSRLFAADGLVRISRHDFRPEKQRLNYLRSQSKPVCHHIQIEQCFPILAQTDQTGKVAGGISYDKWYGMCVFVYGSILQQVSNVQHISQFEGVEEVRKQQIVRAVGKDNQIVSSASHNS